MKKKLLMALWICLSLVLFHACDEPETNEITSIHLDPRVNDSLPLSSIAKKIEYIALESHPDALLGPYGTPRFFEDKIFIVSNKSVYCFHESGLYLYKISRVGQGPGEYVTISSLLIDSKSRHLEILDRQNRNILLFSLDDGSFISIKECPTHTSSFQLLNDSTYLLYTRGLGAIMTDGSPRLEYILFTAHRTTGKLMDGFFPGESRLYPWYPFIWSDEQKRVYLPYNDTVYNITADTIIPAFAIDFGELQISPSYFPMSYMDKIKNENLRDNKAYLFKVMESDHELLLETSYDGNHQHHFWSKSSGKTISFTKIYDDIDQLDYYFKLKTNHKNRWICMIDAVDIITQENFEETSGYKKLIQANWEPNENSNPIIALISLKKQN
ncbi:MAG: 6-bladed beta-propeller [Bacteroidetes bacterium]|nr:6-bladed beta-propeller [Deltaproteobacteria bacterium]MBT4410546.1 6-bladed beta-propeller [Bacteroidota bacterium]MBT5427629.1 6-bladed beta-propeller [Bacteroidota bacterium]